MSVSRNSLALLTDLYELTMAYGYWKSGKAEEEAVFHLFFRRQPFQGGYTVAAGLESVVAYINNFHFSPEDLNYLSTLQTETQKPLFEEDFLRYLEDLRLSCDLDAVVEGEIVFPNEPLIRVQGPLLQAQILESALLNLVNFSSLIATKAARICYAAQGEPVIEFGLRRAQGVDGALTASRSSYIGGCEATSNLLAGKMFGIPVKGTHAHSWIMAFDSEIESFEAYANAMPDNCFFLVDTFDTVQGVKNAIIVGKKLREKGRQLLGIRLDSGDLTYLSIQARKLLDAAGFTEAKILATNELNEFLIADMKNQGAKIALWGVGTQLVTGHSQAALDGVYKISALKKEGQWQNKIKLSESMSKTSTPGLLQVQRFFDPEHGYSGDAIIDIRTEPKEGVEIIDPLDATRRKFFSSSTSFRSLLVPLFRQGKCVYNLPTLASIQHYAKKELEKFDRSIKRFTNPHLYPVGIERSLYQLKLQLIEEIRKK